MLLQRSQKKVITAPKASDHSNDASMHSARSNVTASSNGSMNMIQKMEAADLKDDQEFDLDNL